MVKYIPNDVKTTLEFGCGVGRFSAMLKSRLGAEVWAVEIDEAAAREATKRLDRVINADAFEALGSLPDSYFDCIIFNDILEHLVDPYGLLWAVRDKLTPHGVIVCSLPNARYCDNYIEFVLHGNWDYREAGILDKTHLRFFTYKSIRKTFEQLAFEIIALEGMHPSGSKKLKLLNAILLNALRDLKYVQYAVVAKPMRTP